MRKAHKVLALALGSIMGLAAFAACGDDTTSKGDAPNYLICYDNLASDDIAIDPAYTQVTVENASVIAAYDASGNKVDDWRTIVTYENGVFSAVSEGRAVYRLSDGTTGNIQVTPAYPTDPGNDYSGTASDFNETGDIGESVLGHTHDPSIIETRNQKGESIYYMFSTGWSDRTEYNGITTYGNAIHISYDGMKTWEFLGRTFDDSLYDTEVVNSKIGEWLYGGGTLVGDFTAASASWWAPDIVAKPDGSGYWLYTCVVDGGDTTGGEGILINGYIYTRACILLYESTSLEPGSFHPVLDSETQEPVVLVQSNLINGPNDYGSVNAIDPQIIYTPDGDMYMAYASFGSGNYVLQLDPATGRRLEVKDENGNVTQIGETGWLTPADMVDKRNELAAITVRTPSNQSDSTVTGEKDWQTGQSISHFRSLDQWSTPYYGTNIGKGAMEAPVIARHDNVVLMDENEKPLQDGEGNDIPAGTYYYTMHSYDGLSDNYQLWGGRSKTVTGPYQSATGTGDVYNANSGYPATPSSNTQGNKYMGSFLWANKPLQSPELNAMLPGHNDLFTMSNGTSVTAYITRASGNTGSFTSQIHQYYLNSYGEIVINPNRYAGELDRAVSADELFAYTRVSENWTAADGSPAYDFEMVVLTQEVRDNVGGTDGRTDSTDIDNGTLYANNVSRTVVLTRDAANGSMGSIYENSTGVKLGTWKMYGNGYIAFHFDSTLKGYALNGTSPDSGETDYYGVVRPAWLNDQNRSGFTITCLGQTEDSARSMTMFMNNYSTITGEGLVGETYSNARPLA